MELICKNCDDEFEPNRIDQIFCCSKCRVQYNNWQYQMEIKPYKEAVRNLKKQDFNLEAIYYGNRENAVIRRSQFREHGIKTKYATTTKKEGSTLSFNFVKFGLKSIGIAEYQVYMLTD